ncbi:NAD dependent epimerase/dehydratase [Capsaspora owczarzaki ATCC 30864]|uniref:NAD dependent epimerase/dehydratase n=1 Tax=Capsaspora owczarzaki (strain ATCC 30864) TaxID=595528 RepID=A0A0D2VXJ8_CAPO3|nr:NAD dependent epimerase/dehydratase [Capsaspora owczarzaki ATCC 30864]KJE96387.1 NAD dependent epimerase/dehydratase [Capsaspora owczarzaki ATCC 30864]|eukprot:XP_004344342.1 NAD dependent epimerase/dehydratase [Capsaspora owczarzaki ATCC 30864]
MQEASVYTPHRILVTGGAGFIGSHVCAFLLREYPQYRVVCLDSLEPCASLKNLDAAFEFGGPQPITAAASACLDGVSEPLPSLLLDDGAAHGARGEQNRLQDRSKPPAINASSTAPSPAVSLATPVKQANPSQTLGSLTPPPPRFRFVRGSIENVQLLQQLFADEAFDTVLHFAAQSHVDLSFGNSLKFTQTNVLGTHALIECARLAGVKRFIHVSTDEVYGATAVGHAHAPEEQLPDPTNPYACSKAAAELVAKSYMMCFGMPIIITRSNNVYGPGQFPEKVVPKFILRLLRGEKCCLHGDGSALRTYLHVDDVCAAFDVVLHRGHGGEIYNFGSDDELSIRDLAKTLVRQIRPDCDCDEWIEQVDDRLVNDRRYSISSAKLAALGWVPRVGFLAGLQSTIDWYRQHILENHEPYWSDFELALQPHPTLTSDSNGKNVL